MASQSRSYMCYLSYTLQPALSSPKSSSCGISHGFCPLRRAKGVKRSICAGLTLPSGIFSIHVKRNIPSGSRNKMNMPNKNNTIRAHRSLNIFVIGRAEHKARQCSF